MALAYHFEIWTNDLRIKCFIMRFVIKDVYFRIGQNDGDVFVIRISYKHEYYFTLILRSLYANLICKDISKWDQ